MKKKLLSLLILCLMFCCLTGFKQKEEVKEITIIGDSITEGWGLEKKEYSYPSVLQDLSGVKVNNLGVAGTAMAHNTDKSFVTRYEDVPETSDIIIIFGGSNDFQFNTTIGNLGDTSEYNLYGSMNIMYNGLRKRCPNAEIIFVTPIHRIDDDYPNAINLYLVQYVDAVKTFANAANCRCIDLYSDEIVNFKPNWTVDMPDGYHPNKDCARLIAIEMKKYLGL